MFALERDYNKLSAGGNHLNDFVLHVKYTARDDFKDIKFTLGITDNDCRKKKRVRGNDHAYVQITNGRQEATVQIVESALDKWAAFIPPRPTRPCPCFPPRLMTTSTFNGKEYGEDYLDFKKGVLVLALPPPRGIDADGWCYGECESVRGWYPPGYAK
jgi:hypothetical protein